MASSSLTIVDNFLEGRPLSSLHSLGADGAAELDDALDAHFAAWESPEGGSDEVRLAPDTRPMRGYALLQCAGATLNDKEVRRADEVYEGDGHVLAWMRRIWAGAMLYADRVVETDPLSIWRMMGGDGSSGATVELVEAYMLMDRMRPLIEAGVVLLAPAPDEAQTAQAIDVASGMSPGEPFDWTLLATLAVAAKCDASVLPIVPRTWRFLEELLRQAPSSGSAAPTVAASLVELDLPLLAGIPAKTLLAIRQDEDVFNLWRADLRMIARTIRSNPDSATFASEAQEVLSDALFLRCEQVKAAVSRSAALRSALRVEPWEVGFGAAGGLGAALAAGLPPEGALVGAGVSGLVGLAVSALAPRPPSKDTAVLAQLLKG